MNSSLIINSTDTAGKAQQKTVTFLNPDVSNADAKTFAQLFNNLSSNTYVDADRVNKINVDDSDSSGGNSKSEPTLTVDSTGKITYNGDGTLFAKSDNSSNYVTIEDNVVRALSSSGYQVGSFTGTVYASEGANFAAKSVSFSK